MDKISIVIPCYRSAAFLTSVVRRIEKVMQEKNYELILVNDCSPDETFSVILDLVAENPCIIGIDLAQNAGQHAAIFAGLHHISGDVVICMDDDGQTPPEAIPDLIDGLGQNWDVVYARYETKVHSNFRNWGSRLNDAMANSLLGKPKNLYLSSFFAMRRYICDEILRYENPFVYLPGLVLRSTKHIRNVDVTHQDRLQGGSGYTLKKLIALWINGFTAFSVKPLRIADFLGAVIAGLGFIYLILTIVLYFVRPDQVAGWNSLMAVMLILGGSIMLMLGMAGEYLGRIYISINRAPQFVVREVKKNKETYHEDY